ncbi:MAG TPA: PucR family transcriptional regulator ligand-binding domain-containing protein [Actinomycetota bacterium]
MALTVRDILAVPGLALRLAAGESGLDRPVRWVHISELEDPTPWLKGGELLLTTGAGIGSTPAEQRTYVKRLSDAGLAGLGVGLGFSVERIPRALVTAAGRAGFPVFEVPYPVPFIAITEAVFTRLLSEQYDLLQRAVDAEHVLTRAVLEGGGVQVVASSLADVVGGWVLLLDLHGMPLAATSPAARQRSARIRDELRVSRPEGVGFSLTLVDQGQNVWIQPVGAQGRVEAFLAVGTPEPLSQVDRIVAGHALSLFAIELAKSRAVAEAERRLQGDFFEALSSGIVSPQEAARGLARFGFEREARVAVVALEGAGADELAYAAEDLLSRSGAAYLVSPSNDSVLLLLQEDADRDVAQLRKAIAERLGGQADVRLGAGGAVTAQEVDRSLREARYALQVCRLEGWDSAGFEDLGTYRLLLSMADPDALRAFADSLLGPLDAYDRDHHGELQASLRAFLQHNARWETASAELYVHRHTLRYRMRKVEELTGRDLSSSFDRMEFWLALRARELLAAQDAQA